MSQLNVLHNQLRGPGLTLAKDGRHGENISLCCAELGAAQPQLVSHLYTFVTIFILCVGSLEHAVLQQQHHLLPADVPVLVQVVDVKTEPGQLVVRSFTFGSDYYLLSLVFGPFRKTLKPRTHSSVSISSEDTLLKYLKILSMMTSSVMPKLSCSN